MPQKPNVAIEDRFAELIDASLDPQAEALAERLGPAPGSARYSAREIDELWDTPDASVNPDELFAALQQGITEEGARAVALFKMAPELAKAMVGTPQPPATAAAVAKLAEYPGRYVLTAGHSSDATDQVRYVADMHKKAAKRQQQAAPMTTMAAPQEGY